MECSKASVIQCFLRHSCRIVGLLRTTICSVRSMANCVDSHRGCARWQRQREGVIVQPARDNWLQTDSQLHNYQECVQCVIVWQKKEAQVGNNRGDSKSCL